MAQITKTFTSKTRGISVSPDGNAVNVAVEWSDGSDAQTPKNMVSVAVRGGKAYVKNAEVGTVPDDVSKQAAALAASVETLVETLARAGKVNP